MPRLQLTFHATFALKKEDLLKILQAATEEKGLEDSLEGLMERTGLGNRKVGPIKSWATRAGLISGHYLSDEGKIVLAKDPYLESTVTEWLMHFYLSLGNQGMKKPPDDPADWGGWSYFVYTFLAQHNTFTVDELENYSKVIFDQESPKNLLKRFKFVLRAYTESQALGSCKFLTLEEDQYFAGHARLPNPYLVGYFLAKLWERDFNGEGSVLTEFILNHKMGLGPVLGVKPESLQEQLNALEAYGIIEQRRAVPPFQVIPRWDRSLALLEKAYDSDR
ncbi:MAG: hypothetical protein NVS2B14_16290 [Chamaesiphon sp.]